jgi:hypothetical protein
MRFVLPTVLAAIGVSLSASATASEATPKDQTRQLAQLLAPESVATFSMGSLADIEARLQADMLNTTAAWRGRPCDPEVAACRDAAAAIAKRRAPAIAALQKQVAEDSVAAQLQGLTATETAAALLFMKSPEGQALAKHLRVLIGPPRNLEIRSQTVNAYLARFAEATKGMTDEFYDATETLPRQDYARIPAPAPPPPPPTSKPARE